MSEVVGTVIGHRDGHGFVQRDDGYVIMEAENAQVNDLTSGTALFELQSLRPGG